MSKKMKNKLYYLKVFLLQHRIAAFAVFPVLAAALCLFLLPREPKIPKTEADFTAALAEGEALFAAKRYEDAFKHLIYPAQHGLPRAQYLMGELYFYGRGTQPDSKKAVENYMGAADRIVEAKYKAAMMVFRGETKALPKGTATAWLGEAAYAGYRPAQRDLGVYSLMSGDYERAYFWLTLAQGDDNPRTKKALEMAAEKLSGYQRGLLETEIKDFHARK